MTAPPYRTDPAALRRRIRELERELEDRLRDERRRRHEVEAELARLRIQMRTAKPLPPSAPRSTSAWEAVGKAAVTLALVGGVFALVMGLAGSTALRPWIAIGLSAAAAFTLRALR